MKIAAVVVRVLLGVGFIVFGLNILHPFLPMPPLPEGSPTAQFMAVMGPSGWMKLVGLFQVFGGLFVLSGRAAPLGLALLAPVLVNILAFHALIQGGAGIAPGLIFTVLEAFLIYAYRGHFAPLFSFSAKPTVG
jgi:putative oxidoreductase